LLRCALLTHGDPDHFPLGQDAVGLLTYSACGTMSVAIMQRDRPQFEAADILRASDAEWASAAAGYLSYAGTYSVDEDYVTHAIEVSLFPNWIGTRQVRRATLATDKLTLSTDPITIAGQVRVAVMEWQRCGI
jgi:hypothetical protein